MIASMSMLSTARAANILWASDVGTPGTFSGPGSNYTDQGFITLLQNAGHNVTRWNPSNNNATAFTAAELLAINTNDLIIVGRAAGSGSYQNQRATNWNRDVIKPVMIMSPYLVRTDGNRLGWFGNGNGILPDDIPTPLKPGAGSDPTVDYIFGDVAMNGTNTAELYDEAMDRNTSHISIANTPVAGAVVIASATFPRENDAVTTNGNAIVGFPAGTAVRGGADILPAYRMYFSGGTRESATAPNLIWFYTGRENLTPAGENIFLRAIQVALNNGVAPSTNTGPAAIVSSPTNVTVLQGQPVALAVTVSGAGPRTVEWQRDDGTGTFTNIPGTVSAFVKSIYSLPVVGTADNGARFQVVVANALGMATSAVATVTVTPDTAPPIPLSAASFDGTSLTVCFNELVDPGTAGEVGNYQVNGGAVVINGIALHADGRTITMSLGGVLGSTATLDIFATADIYNNLSGDVVTMPVVNYGFTAVDVGALNPPGTNFTCTSNLFQVSGGGLDLGSTSDFLRLASRSVTGDFDARVRVQAITGTPDHLETTTKAILTARETTANNSAGVDVFITPPAPGDDTMASRSRATAGAAAAVIGTTVTNSGIPNAWIRILRTGNSFSTFRSTNGSNWIAFGTNTIALAQTLNVGVGVVSHRNGKLATGTFSDFKISTPVAAVRLRDWNYDAGSFVAYFDSQNGVTYTVEYKDNLNSPTWNTLTTIVGNGMSKDFTDPGPVSTTGSRFYRVTAQ